MENRTSLETNLLAMNISWLHEDLEVFENSFDLTISLVFTLARFITLILAIIVHRTFYKLMQRLPGRAVNQIIYPYMVSCQKTIFTGSAFLDIQRHPKQNEFFKCYDALLRAALTGYGHPSLF